uniref:Uncharacterized protein n=1 Tax=Sinocyclocheilus grahami TaxID=75366 RepID=A0A672K7Z5_SINGR
MRIRGVKPFASAVGLLLGLLCAVEAAKGKIQDLVLFIMKIIICKCLYSLVCEDINTIISHTY